VTLAEAVAFRSQLGLIVPLLLQYLRLISNIIFYGDFGQSFHWRAPVSDLIWDRLSLTLILASLSLVFTWIIAIPIGVYSAQRQYSIPDYLFTIFGFLGKGTPDFLLALVLMWISFTWLNIDVGGLMSPQFAGEPLSWAKIVNILSHVWIPIVVLATGGAAGLIRVMRANMLDELGKPYVETAYAQGMSERQVVWRYPVRVALNPFISTVGWALPALFSGDIITAVVLNLPTTGPLLLQSLKMQDMYLAGSFILILSVFTVIGTMISDILLAWSDPRIRYA